MVGLGCLIEGSPDPNPDRAPRCDAPSSPQLPKNLEVRPDDSEETALRKKKKLNMYKRQEKKEREVTLTLTLTPTLTLTLALAQP